MSAVRMFVRHRRSPLPCRDECGADQRQEQIVNLSRRKRALCVDPPVQHENKRTHDVLRQQGGRNGESIVLQREGRRLDFVSNAVDQQLAKVTMHDAASSPTRLEIRGVSTLAYVFEERKTERYDFAERCQVRGKLTRGRRMQDVVDAACQ